MSGKYGTLHILMNYENNDYTRHWYPNLAVIKYHICGLDILIPFSATYSGGICFQIIIYRDTKSRAWMNNNSNVNQWNAMGHQCLDFNGGWRWGMVSNQDNKKNIHLCHNLKQTFRETAANVAVTVCVSWHMTHNWTETTQSCWRAFYLMQHRHFHHDHCFMH